MQTAVQTEGVAALSSGACDRTGIPAPLGGTQQAPGDHPAIFSSDHLHWTRRLTARANVVHGKHKSKSHA